MFGPITLSDSSTYLEKENITLSYLSCLCNVVAWSSNKQHIVSRSNTETEYRSLVNIRTEIICIRSILQELHIIMSQQPLIWCDNLSIVALSANPIFHPRSKHFRLDLYFVCKRVLDKRLSVNHVPSTK